MVHLLHRLYGGDAPVQGSAVGPVSYVVNAGDLIPLTRGNGFCKYTDDTCVVIAASNTNSRSSWRIRQYPLGLVLTTLTLILQESPAIADKPARRQSMPKIAPIRRAYNVVADNTGLSSCV